jgi:acetoin utilization protein AcuB
MRAFTTMTRKVVVAPPRLPLDAAWRVMVERRIRHLPVVEGRRLVGMLSDRDVLLRATLDDDGRVIVPGVEVAFAMTPAPLVCAPLTSVSDLARTMIDRKIDAIPVVEGERLVGLVTSTDLLALLVEDETKQPLPFDFDLEDAEGGQAVA